MGESIAEGTLSRWLKKVGDEVKRDEPIFEISTDKVDAEIPAPNAGILAEVLVTEGWGPIRWGCYPMAPFAGRIRDGRFRYAGREHQLDRPGAKRHVGHAEVVGLGRVREHGGAGLDVDRARVGGVDR